MDLYIKKKLQPYLNIYRISMRTIYNIYISSNMATVNLKLFKCYMTLGTTKISKLTSR